MPTVGGGPPFLIEDADTLIDDAPPLDDDTPRDPRALDDHDTGPTDRPPPVTLATLIDDARGMVEPLAKSFARRVGYRGEIGELCSVGRAALVEAARDHDPARAPFEAYAAIRVRWAMMDHVRKETHGRGVRRRAAALLASELVADALAEAPRSAELPTEETARAALADALSSHAAALAVGLVASRAHVERIEDPGPDPETAVEERRTLERLRDAIGRLPEAQRTLVERHYFHEERFDHIAESLGVSKSWASRLHARAIADLGRSLRGR